MNLFITPHPPIIIDEIGKGETEKASKTILGMKKIAKDIGKLKPKTIAIITPHGNVFRDALCINTEANLKGDFGDFNHRHLSYQFTNSKKAKAMCDALLSGGVHCVQLNKKSARQYNISTKLDHGAMVPLHFILQEYTDFELVHIGIGFLSKTQIYKAGEIIADVLGEDNVLIASGDLSHRLTHSAPSGFDVMGAVYDQLIVESIENKSYIDILTVDENMLDRAGQCAQKPLEMLMGALEGYETQTDVYSYEGPFGVGYMTARIIRADKNKTSVMAQYLNGKSLQKVSKNKSEDEYVALARKTIETYIKDGKMVTVPQGLSDELYSQQKGVFVSIKKQGRLRGCIGTIEPSYSSIANEIIHNAISASTRDPRFNPIEAFELDDLTISVDVLFPPEDIDDTSKLDVIKYGVIVNKGFRRGLLLPNLEGVDSVKEQVSIALQKAGINEKEDYQLQRFRVVRHI
jgi:MEMO1 family protein